MRAIHLILVILVLTAHSGCISTPPAKTRVPQPSLYSGNESQTAIPWRELPADFRNETEVTEYQGRDLTPISRQRNNAIKGTQHIDVKSYRLHIDGLVERPVAFTYNQLIAYPSVSRVVRLECVEGWSFTAKWTGIPIKTLLDVTGIRDNATEVIFYSSDGYSTSHNLEDLIENNIILAYRLNDVTLPDERGFPLVLVAEDKFGYKWAKWILRIELTDTPYKGYWESRGFSNSADLDGPARD